jgi:hypothetical protein
MRQPIMKIIKEKEEIIEWSDNSSAFNDSSFVNLNFYDKLEKIPGEDNSAKFSIFLKFTLWVDSDNVIFRGILHGQYLVTITKDMTLSDFSFFYKRPYLVMKTKFDSYKKDKTLNSITFPEFDPEEESIVFTFKNKLPDTLSK